MKLNALAENAKTLAAALGIGEEEATEFLKVTVAITFNERDEAAAQFAGHVERMLSRTIKSVLLNGKNSPNQVAVEFVIGDIVPFFTAPHLFAIIGKERVIIGSARGPTTESSVHPVGLLLGACYAVGAILKKAFKDLLPFPSTPTLDINLAELVGDDLPQLYEPVLFDEAYLVGAGAIGNGFIYGLSQFRARGSLHIVDDDTVSDGNLQRCVFFTEADISQPKVDCLCREAKAVMPEIQAIPHEMLLHDVPAAQGGGAWLKRLVVGVDTPRARRRLQSQIPGEVYDASTTGISEVVVHFNRQPNDLACMSCVYYESPDEHAHERHVAEALGVSVEDVKQGRITEAAASLMCKCFPHLKISDLIGSAYDTLFKQEICSSGRLTTPEGRQVLAPFAFVSVLAGTLLAIEFARRLRKNNDHLFNVWHVSPWTNPVLKRRRLLEKRAECEFCGNPILAQVARQLWQKN